MAKLKKSGCMNVRDLLSECAVSDMLSRFPKHQWEPPYQLSPYQAFYERLMRKRPKNTGIVVLGIPWPQDDDDYDEGCVQTRCFKIKELVDGFDFSDPYLKIGNPKRMALKAMEALPRHWQLPGECGMEIISAENTMGYEVFVPNADRVGRVNLATWIFFELASYGLTLRAQRAAMRRLERDLRESEKDIAEGRYYTMEEIREEFGLPKLTRREEAKRHRQSMITGTTFARDLIGAMAEYVQFKRDTSTVKG